MILKYNNGRGALLCEHCRVIVMQDIRDYEWHALRELDNQDKKWFCKDCCDTCQHEQAVAFVETVNVIAPMYSENKQQELARKHNTIS